MRRILPFTFCLLLLFPFPFVQAQNKNDDGRDAEAEQTLKKIEQEIADAEIKNDTTVLERYYADTCAITLPDGTTQDKTAFLTSMKSGDMKFETIHNDKMRVQLYGNTAVVTYRTAVKGAYKEEEISSQFQVTNTFVKMEKWKGRWQIVADQGTPISQ